MVIAVVVDVTEHKTALVFFIILGLTLIMLLAIIGYFEEPDGEMSARLKARVSRESFLQNLSSSLHTPFMILNETGRIVFISDALSKLFPHLQPYQHYSTLARSSSYVDAIRSALSGRDIPPFIFETHRRGDRVFEAVTSQIDLDQLGEIRGRLLVEVIDRTDERRMDVMRRDFIANASHELRTPLSAITGGIETISDDPTRETVKHFIPIMTKEAERMRRLIDDLMSLSRIEMNEHYPPEESANLKKIVEDSVKTLEMRGELDNAKINNHFTDDVYVVGDYDQLQQVVINILDNAVKYSGNKPEIEIEPAQHSESFPGLAGLSISDNGEGIPAHIIPRLTERFYRVSVDESRDKGGTGLGLAIVKHMIRRHRGELQIESKIGEGSTFTIWLPEDMKQ